VENKTRMIWIVTLGKKLFTEAVNSNANSNSHFWCHYWSKHL